MPRNGALDQIVGSLKQLLYGVVFLLLVTTQVSAASPIEDVTFGDSDAPLSITQYVAYGCRDCAEFREHVFPRIQPLIDSGRVRYTIRAFPRGRDEARAIAVGLCVFEMKGSATYRELESEIYRRRSDWITNNDAETRAALIQIARAHGITEESYDQCVARVDVAERIQATMLAAREASITTFPSFQFDGEFSLAPKELTAIIDVLGAGAHSTRRAEPRRPPRTIVQQLSYEGIRALLEDKGRAVSAINEQFMSFAHEGQSIVVGLAGRDSDLSLVTYIQDPELGDSAHAFVNNFNSGVKFGRAYVDSDGDIALQMDRNVQGGATLDQFEYDLAVFLQLLKRLMSEYSQAAGG